MANLIWPSPAKINLFLHITGRRPDGYHLLQTVFQFLAYGDELIFTVLESPEIRLDSNLPAVPPQDNLALRAAKLLQARTKTCRGAHIHLRKRLPLGGGLGGGSSNAATTLVALNQLWETQCSQQTLLQLGLQLGADVPIFIHGQAAFAEGIGEKFQTIALPTPWYVILVPPCQVATQKIYCARELTRDTSPITIRDFLVGRGHNDFEPVVRKHYPEVAAGLDFLAQFAPPRLSGSGSCVFAAFASRRQAAEVAEKVSPPFKSFIAQGANQSPLLDCLLSNWGVAKR